MNINYKGYEFRGMYRIIESDVSSAGHRIKKVKERLTINLYSDNITKAFPHMPPITLDEELQYKAIVKVYGHWKLFEVEPMEII